MTTENQNPAPVDDAAAALAAQEAAAAEAAKLAAANTLSLSKPEPKPDPTYEYDATGDPALDVAFGFLGARGIPPTDPAVVAAKTGDFTALEEKLAAMGDKAKGYQSHIALGKKAYADAKSKAEEQSNATLASVEQAVGGSEQWEAIRLWAGEHASDAEKADVNAALQAGGLRAKSIAEYLAKAYAKANPQSKLPASAVKPNAAGVTASTEPLTAKAYNEALRALTAKSRGRDVSGTPEYASLQAQRRAAIAKGVK